MTIKIIPEKLGGNFLAATLPLFVYDDGHPPDDVDVDDAIDAVEAAAGIEVPTTMFDLPPDGNAGIARLTHSSFRVTINYRPSNQRLVLPVTGSTVRPRFAAVAERREVRWAPEVGGYASGGSVGGSIFNGLVNVQFSPGGTKLSLGAVIDPPQPNIFVQFAVPIADVTPTWGRTVASCVGRFNSSSLTSGTYAAGTIFLCSVQGQLGSSNEFLIDIAWSYKPNVTGETRGEVTGIAYRGHDYVWEVPKRAIDRDKGCIFGSPRFVIVNQVHPSADLSAIGISPP